jgi:protocatechuate 3,4-dioxygenase beta subunit
VTITGVVEDGNDNSVADASCSLVDSSGTTIASDDCDSNGIYRLKVPPGETGNIYCGPKTIPGLNLSTVVSTVGVTVGETLDSENITPTTTVVADIIRYENPADLNTRKMQLIQQAQADPNLKLVVAMAGRLFRAMLANNINARFGDDRSGGEGGDGGDGGRGDSGGVGGDAGDGADFSPLPEARCSFILDEDLLSAEAIYPAALADFLADGELDRPDLVGIAATVMSGVTESPEVIRQAFETWFPDGLGEELVTLTDEQGAYFLPVPANLPGYVRCTPKDQQNLVLGTYIPARVAGADLMGQDVSPATTIFSTLIASQLQGDLTATKQNFLDDIAGLKVLLSGDNLPEGPLDGITLGDPPTNSEVGLVAFSATALFNAFLKGDLDVDFPAAIDDLVDNLRLTTDFLEAQGVSATQAQETAALVNPAISNAEGQLGTTLAEALSTARIEVTVLDAADGSPIPDAVVDIENGSTGNTTDSEGRVTLTLSNITLAATDVRLTVSASDYSSRSSTTQVVAFATVDLTVRLSAVGSDQGTVSGTVVDALGNTPLAGVTVTVWDDGEEIATDTTNEQGNYSISCAQGSAYTLTFEANGYLSTQYDGVTVTAGSTTFLEAALQVSEANSGNGDIAGTIRSALNNEGIAGALLQLREGINNISGSVSAETTTDANGGYFFEAIPAGVYTVAATHDDYLEMHFTVFSAGEQTGGAQDASMSPVLESGEIRIVLTWGATPSDLDSHLTGPSSSGDSFHCYYGNKEPDPGYVNLDIDDVSSYGPETTTIIQHLPGTYEFSVWDYTNRSSATSSALSNSGAQVKVYGDAGEIATFNVPSGQGGTLWTVFTLDGASGQITPQNSMSYLVNSVTTRQLWGENGMPSKEELP